MFRGDATLPRNIGKYIPRYMIPNVPDWEHGEVYAMAHDPQEVYTMAYDSHGSGERTPLLRNMGNHIPWYMIPDVPDWERGEVYTMVHDSQCSGEGCPCPETLGSIYRGI